MKIENLIEELGSDSRRNEALTLLYKILVDTDEGLTKKLAEAIKYPNTIEDTNRFASLLADLGSESFIEPLIQSILTAAPGVTTWLSDYMYALGSLLIDREDLWPAEHAFVDLLGNWLLSTGGGEISWKAGDILAHLRNPNTRQYLLNGAFDQSLFHQTRIACIHGIVNQYRTEAATVLQGLSTDSDEHVRSEAANALQWIRENNTEA